MSVIGRALAEFEAAPDLPAPPRQLPPDPAPARRGLRPAPYVVTGEQRLSIEDGQRVIETAIAEYLAQPMPGYALLLALPPGSGKTTAMVATAERVAAGGQRVLYAGPRHDFFADVQAIAQRPQWWYEWLPRRLGNEHQTQTCRWAPQMERWLHRGYPAIQFCKQAGVCGWAYVQGTCPYHAQSRITQPIVYVQHQHVALKHPLMEQAALLIGDELPLGAFLQAWTIPQGAIVVSGSADELEQLLWTLRSLCATPAPRNQGGWSGPALLAELGGARYVADLCAQYNMLRPGIDAVNPTVSHPDQVDGLDYFYLPYLLSLLEQEAQASLDGLPDYVRRVRCSVDGLTLLKRHRPNQLPQHIIWCDATGNGRLYERLLGMPVKTVQPNIEMRGRVYQFWASLNNKGALAVTPDGDEQRRAQSRKLERLNLEIARILERGQYQRPGIISYKTLIDDLAPDVEVVRGYFGAERGTNRFVDCDVLIVVGTPQPPLPALVDAAAMLFDERIAAFDAAWSTRDLQFAGQPYAYPIGGFWDDPELQLMLEQSRDAELLQSVHRARPLRRDVDVWLLTNAPLDGLPVDLVSLHDLFDAPTGVDAYSWPEVRRWAAARVNALGRLTVPELAEALGKSLPTARKMVQALARQDGYQIEPAPAQGRGKPPLSICKALSAPEY